MVVVTGTSRAKHSRGSWTKMVSNMIIHNCLAIATTPLVTVRLRELYTYREILKQGIKCTSGESSLISINIMTVRLDGVQAIHFWHVT